MKRTWGIAGTVIAIFLTVWLISLALDRNQAPISSAAAEGAQKGASAQAVHWRPSIEAALKEAKTSGKPVMVDFFATWCGPCHLLDEAYTKPAVAAELQNWITVRVDIDKNPSEGQTYKAEALPTMIFLAPGGRELGRKVGFMAPPGKEGDELMGYLVKDVVRSLQENKTKLK